VAQGLNGNPALVEYILRNMDGAAAAQQLNANEAWLTSLVQHLDANSLANALNTALGTAGGQAFMAGLLNTLDGGIVARALNANPQLTREMLRQAGTIGLGNTLQNLLADANAGAPGAFLTDLITELDPNMIINVLNNGRNAYHGDSRLPYSPYSMLEVTWFQVATQASLLPGVTIYMWTNILGGLPYDW